MDRLSMLVEDLLVTILSLLPADLAARTSVLSREYRDLWKGLTSVNLTFPQSGDYSRFFAMARHALLRRNSPYPLLTLALDFQHYNGVNALITPPFLLDRDISSLLSIAHDLSLKHLTIKDFNSHTVSSLLRVLLSMETLESLTIDPLRFMLYECFEQGKFPPSTFTLPTCLKRLSLTLYFFDPPILEQFISQLSSLEDLQLILNYTPKPGIRLSSRTITNLKLIIHTSNEKVVSPIELSLPSVQAFHLTIKGSHAQLHHCNGKVPLLRKAVIDLDSLCAEDVTAVHQLLSSIAHVEDLALHFKQNEDLRYPIPTLLEPGKDAPNLFYLKNLDVRVCFHSLNHEALLTMLHRSPSLESINLNHDAPRFALEGTEREVEIFDSKLPHNGRNASFRNLHLGDNRERCIELMTTECISKRKASN